MGLFLSIILLTQSGWAAEIERSVYNNWNKCVKSIVAEDLLWRELHASLSAERPGLVRNARRLDIYDELIKFHEERIELLRKMRSEETK